MPLLHSARGNPVALQRHRYAIFFGDDKAVFVACYRELLRMNGVDQLREDLAFVDRMIAECKHHITRLQTTTAEMARDGQDVALPNDVLATFTAALARHEAERERVMSAIKNRASVANLDRSRSQRANVSRRKAARRAAASAAAAGRRHKSLVE